MTVTGIFAVWLKRGTIEKKHATHAADIVAIVSVQVDADKFKTDFQQQFQADAELGLRVRKILGVRPLHRAFSCTKSSSWRISRLTVMLAGRSVKRSRERTS